MAVQVLVAVEEYLRTSYEHDREYVRGEVVERGMPTRKHSWAQARILEACARLAGRKLFAYPELRVSLGGDVFRIPDVAIFDENPAEDVPSTPPLAAVEIVSPDDRFSALTEKCREYQRWGVAHIWIVDPQNGSLHVFRDDSIKSVAELSLPDHGLSIPAGTLFT